MSIKEKTGRTIGDLLAEGDSPDGLFAALRAAFNADRNAASTDQQVRSLRDRWLGRRSGLLSAANEHWLKAAPRELKPTVGRLQNILRRELAAAVKEAARAASKPMAEDPGLDVTLPGQERIK